jgi:hypothetical protein
MSEQTAIIFVYSVICFHNRDEVCLLRGTSFDVQNNSG